jgi:hypothetical protein
VAAEPPGATSVLEDVAPDVFVVSVAVVALPADVDPAWFDAESTPVVAVGDVAVPVIAADPLADSPDDVWLEAELAEDVPVASAADTP